MEYPARRLIVALVLGCIMNVPVLAQEHEATGAESGLEGVLNEMFDFFLRERLNLGEGFHSSHYIPAAGIAQQALAPALSNLVSGNVASFPLSATQVGIELDFSTGVPVKVIDRQGPIFAQTAQTLGRKHFSAGFNYTHLNLTQFRGGDLDDLTFTFTHEDFAPDGGSGIVGDSPTERDLVIIRPRLGLTAGIAAIYATYGILENLDIGIALPIVSIQTRGVAEAFVESWTLDNLGSASHFLGGTAESPVLDASHRYEESETYLHAIAVQAKYQLPSQSGFDSAILLDVRIPTGGADRLLREGSLGWNVGIIGSGSFDLANPHVNILYNNRGAEWDSDRISYAVGFDRRLSPGVTLVLDLLGDVALNQDRTIRLYDPARGPLTPLYTSYPGTPQDIPLSNVEDRDHDNTLNLSAGSRIAFSPAIQALVNVIVPLGSGGLYATWIPTAGLSVIL